MSVRQLMAYHSLVLFHKTKVNQSPVYLYKKITAGGKFPYNTRKATTCPPGFSFEVRHPVPSGAVRLGDGARLGLSKQGWCLRSGDMYNSMPADLRLEKKLKNFKKRLKDWVRANVSI